MKHKRNISEVERQARRERMLAYHANKQAGKPVVFKQPKVNPEELREVTPDSPKSDKVSVFIRNPIKINGVSYGGLVKDISPQLAMDLQSRSDMVDLRRIKEHDSTEHPFQNLGRLG